MDVGDVIALRDGEAPQVTPRGRDVDGALIIDELAVAQVKCSKAGARREKAVELNRMGVVEVDNLERGEGVGAEGVAEGNSADTEEGEAHEAGEPRREAQHGAHAQEMIGYVDVEVLDVTGGGVVEAAVDVLVAEVAMRLGRSVIAEVEGEGEAVEASPAAALERLEQPVRVVAGAVVEVEGGRRGAAARPERPPRRGERACGWRS